MKKHEKLIFLRLITGTDQQTLAETAKITQRAMTHIEKGKYGLNNNRLELFSAFFDCRKEWFVNDEPPIYEQWGYWEFPPKSIVSKKKSAGVRLMHRQEDFIRSELGNFLVENKVTKYVFAKVKNKTNTLYFFKLSEDSFLLINTNIVMLAAIEEGLKEIPCQKKIIIDADILNFIGAPYDDNIDPDKITDLFKKAGFTVKKRFVKNITRKKIVSPDYLYVEKIARMIIEKNLNLAEIDACVQKMKKKYYP